MSKHTPGPWKAVSAAACAEIEVMEIAEVAHMRVIPAGGGWPTAGEPEDDARLIAAAPELLAAIESILACCDEEHAARDYASRQTEIRGIALAARAKAEGRA